MLGEDLPMVEVCKRLEVTEQTYYRWRIRLWILTCLRKLTGGTSKPDSASGSSRPYGRQLPDFPASGMPAP